MTKVPVNWCDKWFGMGVMTSTNGTRTLKERHLAFWWLTAWGHLPFQRFWGVLVFCYRGELKKHITEGFRGLCYTIWQAKEKWEKLVKGHEAFTKREKSASTKWEQEELKWALQNNLSIIFDSVLVHISQYLRALSTDQKSARLEWNGLNWNDKMKRFWKKNPQYA